MADAASPLTRKNNMPLALLWMLGALTSFSLIAIAGREAGRGIDTVQIMFWRSLIGLPIVALVAIASGAASTTFSTQRLGLHSVRAAVHFVAQFSWLHALGLITLAELFALEFTAPLWVAVLAPLLLGERLTVFRGLAACLGFVGVLVIAQPGTATFGLGTALAMVSALGFALSMIATKLLTRTESTMAILFHMTWIQLALASALIGFQPRVPDAATCGWIAAVAVLGLTAHFSLARAFTYADAINVAPMDFLRLPLITLVGAVVYGEAIAPMLMMGALIVVVANALNLWGERRARLAASRTPA